MCDLQIIKELILEQALVLVEKSSYGKRQVKLIEPKASDRNEYSVIIHNIPEKAIIIKTDAFPAPKDIFKGDKGECKRGDFVIITEKIIVFIELKRGKGKTPEIIQQLKGSQCVIDYFRTIVAQFWNINILDEKHYQYRFVSIHHIGSSKKTTFQSLAATMHDKPEKMLKVNTPNRLEFKKIVSENKYY